MTLVVKVGHAKTRLSELLARVEGGEDIIIARGETPIARLSRVETRGTEFDALIEEIRAARRTYERVALDEILQWKDEGRR